MLLKLFKKDFLRNYIILSILFLFMTLSIILVSSGTFMIDELFSSMSNFFEKSEVPHVVQMHAGEIDRKELESFIKENDLIKEHQFSKMITINNRNILFKGEKLKTNIMDISFVTQNESFDYLLNSENRIIPVKKNHIAVPVYYKEKMDLVIGDTVEIQSNSFDKTFTIQYFLRDAQMNASIISSKRFLINYLDYNEIGESFNDYEYLIEFLLKDEEKVELFKKQYSDADLPQKGPMVDYSIFQIMNALSDGIIAVVIIFVSILLMAIALLSIRFSIITTIEEDFESIGVMKTIGLQYKSIKRIYHFKYILISIIATIFGYLISFKVSPILTENISIYMGNGTKSVTSYLLPLFGSLMIMLLMIFFCGLIINRFKKISPIDTLQIAKRNPGKKKYFWSVSSFKKFNQLPVNWHLSLKDFFVRSKMYSILVIILIICILIVIIPFNFLTTLSDSSFTSYMGIGQSDLRIDIQNNDDSYIYYEKILKSLENDPDVKKVSGYITSQYEVQNSDGYYEGLNIEVGNFNAFPLKYLKGEGPNKKNEIALSKLNADSLNVGVDDYITIKINGQIESIKVTGIYQDITNGGKTAKGLVEIKPKNIMWQIISLDLNEGVNLKDKINELKEKYPTSKITGIEEYLDETFKETIKQVQMVINFSTMIAVALLILITSLFTKMIVMKDQYEISILMSIGLSKWDIRKQYILRIIFAAILAILIASIIGNILGATIVSSLMSLLGASKIDFIINPIMVYFNIPMGFIFIIGIVTVIATQSIKKVKVSRVFN